MRRGIFLCFQAEDGIRDLVRSRGLGDVYKRQLPALTAQFWSTDTIIAWLKPMDYVYYTPNAFTPNDDGINDVFFPVNNVVDLETYELSIFDRWGGQIYQSTDPAEGWDGTSGSGPMPAGVYAVSYTHLRAHETVLDLVCRLLLEKKKRDKRPHDTISEITTYSQTKCSITKYD